MLQAGWKHLMEKLVEEMRRVLRALAKLQLDQDSSAAFDLFLVRCLVLVLTTCFSDDHQEVSQRQCNSPKVVAELLRNVLMLASSRIEHLVEEEIDCLICHPSKHVRDVLTELMTRKSLPLLDLSTSYAEKRLEVIGVHAEVNDDVRPPAGDATGSKKRQACMWRELDWSGRQGERLQGAIYLPQNKCLVSSTVTHCVKHSSPKHHSQQHVQHLDMLLRFGSHPYFLTLLAFQLRPMPCFYITEDASECRLLSLLLDRRVSQRWIQPAPLLMAALDIIYAIRFLAEEHIALRDITTYNMVYAVKGEGEDVGITVKLADLGLSHEYCAETDTYQSQEVRPQRDPGPIPVRWTAREALFEGLYSDRSMIYSFGYVLYELFTHGCQPYSEISRRSTDDILRLLFLRSKSVRPFHWPCLPDGVYSLIRKCTSLRPKDRPTLDEVETALKQLLQKSKDGEQSSKGTLGHNTSLESVRRLPTDQPCPGTTKARARTDADNYKNLQEYSWAASSSLRVKETELMTSDPITIPPAGESSFICVEEWLTPDFVGNQLPRLESNRAVLPGVVAWAQNRLSPYPDHAVHERQYTRAVTLLHAARRLCRDPLDYAPVAAMVNACLQLTKVVCEIHEQGWLHRDIRASNVLVECGTDQVLLARIGRMVYLAGADYVRGEVFTGSRRWMAPEVLHTGIYTKENDVFMLGTTFWEIWNARNVCARDPTATERHLVPLAYVRQKDVENMVQEGVLLPDLPEMPSWLYTLICQCRHPDRKERPSIRDVLFQLEKNSTGYANTISTYGNVNI
ncbi:hypothetical protein BaRGS_00004507 [Batillaria attramentaria]|uniref:Protein kinase domain-containing protein n=1 Tax=Batillaria attramentaria TaxID=370345 RepID=A0ABD0LXP9_9CAEN